MPKDILTQERLKEILDYHPDTGLFIWVKRITNRINIGDIAGTMDAHGYMNIQIDSVIYKAHRLVFLYMDGYFPVEVDHIYGIRSDNRYLELRAVNRKENCKNAKMPASNTSGVVGVSWDMCRNKWSAKIGVSGKTVNLGRFKYKQDAVFARKQAEKEHGFHENHGRS